MANASSGKRVLIDKANSTVVLVTSVAAFIFVFSAIATKTLIAQSNYQNHVINAKRETLAKLESNVSAAGQLSDSYKKFTSTPQNAIGGSTTGTGERDGDNTKIVLDALPSTYDFPALVNSLEAVLGSQQVRIASISGTDDEVTQSANQSSSKPEPVPIPFQLSVEGDYSAIQSLVKELERSVRPIQIQTIGLSGSQNKLTMTIAAQTFYQPAKTLNFSSKVVQ